MSNTDILQVCARLEGDKSFAGLFDILRDYGDTLSAVWLKGDKELSLSYAEMTRRADDFAAYYTLLGSLCVSRQSFTYYSALHVIRVTDVFRHINRRPLVF